MQPPSSPIDARITQNIELYVPKGILPKYDLSQWIQGRNKGKDNFLAFL